MPINLRGIPQVIPHEQYLEHLAGASDSREATVRLFASLSLARLHPDIKSWVAAAEALGMPGPMGVRCARACSATMLITADEWEARIRRAIEETPRENYRALEAKIHDLLGMSRWFDDWARLSRPGTRHGSYDLGLTWQWVHVAHAHLDLSPAWRGRQPTAKGRARYRQFEASLDDKQRGVSLWSLSSCCGCRGLVEGAVAEHREQDVAAAACETDQGSVVLLAFGSFPVVVGAADGVVKGCE